MYCTQLLELDELSEIQRESIDKFLERFLPNGFVTVSNASEYTGIKDKVITDTFTKLYLQGYLDIVYAVRCPQCGHMLKKIEKIDYSQFESIDNCYACDESIEISESDVVILFVKKDMSPFVRGQHCKNSDIIFGGDCSVAQNDSMYHLGMISDIMNQTLTLAAKKFIKDDCEEQQVHRIRIKANEKYIANKRRYNIISIISRIISVLIILWVVYLTKANDESGIFITVVVYVVQNVVDTMLQSCIIIDYDELERKYLLSDIKYEGRTL